jgi:hypothetical protein
MQYQGVFYNRLKAWFIGGLILISNYKRLIIGGLGFGVGWNWYSWTHIYNNLYTSSVIYHKKSLGRGGHL